MRVLDDMSKDRMMSLGGGVLHLSVIVIVDRLAEPQIVAALITT